MPNRDPNQVAADLRRRAEEQVKSLPPAEPLSEADVRRALHELQVYQIELQLQNESLQKSESQALDALRRLAELHAAMEDRIAQRTADLVIAREAAEAASQAKTAFLSNMSHELRTPMNGVIGMVELALRRATDAQQIVWLSKARRSADHLLSVINDILDISKMEADRLTIDRVEFKLRAVLDLVTSLLAPDVARRGLGFDIDVSPGLADRPLRGDPQRLGQVLLNLGGNAVKFTEQGRVGVSLRIEDETPHEVTLRCEVKDSGIGIASQDQQRLFRAFEQVDDSMTRNRGGTGLGLAICARMVELMGGQIGVESAPGAGSTFWFTVRLEAGEPDDRLVFLSASESAVALADLTAGFTGVRILVAEDNEVNQEVMLGLLEGSGLVVDIAVNGRVAVDMAQAVDYALILMDVQLPELSGIEATHAIRGMPAHVATPIIALTASGFHHDRVRCIESGMNDHIAKPVDPGVLYRTLLRWLRPA